MVYIWTMSSTELWVWTNFVIALLASLTRDVSLGAVRLEWDIQP